MSPKIPALALTARRNQVVCRPPPIRHKKIFHSNRKFCIKAGKDFDLPVVPGAGHGAGRGTYAEK